jgi:predicted HAD superfamily phosphohydrolase
MTLLSWSLRGRRRVLWWLNQHPQAQTRTRTHNISEKLVSDELRKEIEEEVRRTVEEELRKKIDEEVRKKVEEEVRKLVQECRVGAGLVLLTGMFARWNAGAVMSQMPGAES